MSEFTAAMSGYTTGDPTDPSVAYGPLSSENAARNLMAQIDDAVAKGATVHLGGRRLDGPGAFVEATVLSGVTPEMRAYREERFGPAAVVYEVADADAAVELANSSSHGLGGAVFCSDEELALDVADRLDVGMVWINQPEGGRPELPFGGTKRSGAGRELGPLGHRRVREQEAHPHHAQRRVGKWPEPRPAGLARAGDGSRTRMTSLAG
jgi:succinate-semialdehyde dehydrogenase/glutarate-semialdehyde dehydrogenase